MKPYDHKEIEQKWQEKWTSEGTYNTADSTDKPKMYVLDMFPYPSGAGLHVGHPRGYIASDVYARYKRMQGFNVLHPMGFDSFGLPAEQYAIKTGNHPGPYTDELVQHYKQQLTNIGFSYDWSREVATHKPEYYKWTQWIFLKLYNSWYNPTTDKTEPIETCIEWIKNTDSKWDTYSPKEKQDILMKYRIAYEGYAEVNWCPELGTVLANDEIITAPDGSMVSERGEYPVIKKSMRQWFMRISAYADRLLSGLDTIDWPHGIKEIQRNWIGKSEGSEISFKLSTGDEISVFTTRADTLFGVTYVVLAPEHALVQKLLEQVGNKREVEEYIAKIKTTSEDDRTNDKNEKTGIVLQGITAINPANGESVPVWIANYVLANYGTGAVMAVPMHDERDRAFAEIYNLPIIDRPLVDKKEITKQVGGKLVTKYKMRDAIFARQRYWGEPIPLRYDNDGIITPLAESELPLKLPELADFAPAGDGGSPLSKSPEWMKEGYETNTMPGWAGSSWYFLRYMDPHNDTAPVSKSASAYWGQVDMYVGGAEHATGHLLYSRFWNMALYDLGYVAYAEPFKALRNQGLIAGTDGRKMSKRWGNVINPDEVIALLGADTLRVYESFMGPFESHLPWSTDGIVGSRRFIERMYRNLTSDKVGTDTDPAFAKVLHKTIKKVTDDIGSFSFNTAISSLMICSNEFEKAQSVSKDDAKIFLQLLAPFAPYMTEELWHELGEASSVHLATWPVADESLLTDDTVTIGVQINGKVRTELTISTTAAKEEIELAARALPRVIEYTKDSTIDKVIVVPGRIINILTK
jgi:leucyl-tRNA synthetase